MSYNNHDRIRAASHVLESTLTTNTFSEILAYEKREVMKVCLQT